MASGGQRTRTEPVIAYEEQSQPVRIVYDTWTPRPHFIIVQCDPKADATVAERQAAFELTGRFLLANRSFADDAILSFHCGIWYQEHASEWHAHLCVPQQAYLAKARDKIRDIPNNKEWKGANSVDAGMSTWLQRKMANYTKYRDECVKKQVPDRTLAESVTLSRFNSPSNEFTLVWLSPTPRIGIEARTPAQSNLASLYKFMDSVRATAEQTLRQQDRTFANFGCHLCLYVRDQSGTSVTCRSERVLTENGELQETTNTVGYIQMDESQYVQWLPGNIRRTWLNEFARAPHFVRT